MRDRHLERIEEKDPSSMKTLRALFWGGIAGAVLGLLFAPQRGDATRARLRERLGALQQDPTRRTSPSAAAVDQRDGRTTKVDKAQRHANNKAARDAWETSSDSGQNAHKAPEPASNI